MNGSEKRFSRLAGKVIIILFLVAASGSGIFLMKDPGTRTWGFVLFILSFVWLYAYVVKRRTTAGR